MLVMLPLAACGSGPGVTEPEGVDGLTIPTPSPDPRDFVRRVDNPYLPLAPGSRWVYEVAGGATVTVTVGDEPRAVDGVATTVVRERSGTTETERWFAQDRAGNVWIFGEQGTWEAGIDGAQAGWPCSGNPVWATATGRGTTRVSPRTTPRCCPSTPTS